jgi:hypothetical protein
MLLHVHQLLGKFPRRQILGNKSVARLRNNRWGRVFYVVRAEQRRNNGVMQPVSKQRLGKTHFRVSGDVINRARVFRGVCASAYKISERSDEIRSGAVTSQS